MNKNKTFDIRYGQIKLCRCVCHACVTPRDAQELILTLYLGVTPGGGVQWTHDRWN